MKQRDYENLVFSAANLNRPVEKCAVCKLDHGPVQPDIKEIEANMKKQKKEDKKQAICNKLLNVVNNPNEVRKLREYIEWEDAYRLKD